MHRLKTAACAFVLLLSVFMSTVSAAADTRLINIRWKENGKIEFRSTNCVTVQDYLDKNKYILYARDIVKPDLDTVLEQGMVVEIVRGFYAKVSIDGYVEKIKLSKGTSVSKLINMLQAERDIQLVYNGDVRQIITETDIVLFETESSDIVIEVSPIAFTTTRMETTEMEIGKTQLIQKGVAGEIVSTYALTDPDDESIRMLLHEEVTKLPVDEIMLVGVDNPLLSDFEKKLATTTDTSAETFKYTKMLTMEATAYTADFNSTGKNPGDKGFGITRSGMKAKMGLVAVDTKVIPLGTKLYIEGYGFAIAADTGSAIKGNDVDLYFNDHDTCIAFGRKKLTVYILGND